ncbi:MAG: c-type cytochrome [bacterium]|nr:c-type cytochrome [bacterium]
MTKLKLILGGALAAGILASAPVMAWNEGGGEKDEATKIYETFKKKTPEELAKIRKDGIAVYEICSACHLTEGWGSKDGTFPQISGQPATVIIKQLADIRAKNRDNPTMYPFALPKEIKNAAPEVGGGPYAIAAVARYIENIPMNPDPGVGAGTDLEHGAKLYKDNCVKCHGENGEGHKTKFFPLIQGQHYKYLLRQFEWIRDGKRRNANPDMIKQINGFTEKDMKAVVDYVSRMKPASDKVAKSKDWLNPDYD